MTDYTNLRKIVTGDIIIKCRLGNDIRRIPINQVPTYDELHLMMCRVYKSELKDPKNIVLKYTDNEGDLISLSDDIDIDHAISISNLLKVTIFDKSSVKHIPQLQLSLIEIRDSLNELIKTFDIKKEEPLEEKKMETATEEMKQTTRKLTPAELASFDTKIDSSEEKSSVKELTTLSPKAPTSVPYYPPISQSQQQQQQPQTPIQQPPTSNNPVTANKQYIQTTPQPPSQHIPLPQTPQQSNVPVYTPHPPTATPLQQQHMQQQQPFNPSYPLPQPNNGPRNQQPPPSQQMQSQQPQQMPPQQQQQRPMYYNNPPPPHPSGSVSTAQIPPQQQFRPPPTHW